VFEEILGLPAHPLIIHAPVILVPLLIAVAVGYAIVPPWRRAFGWAVVLLAFAAPGPVLLARLSGEAFQARLDGRDQLPAELAEKVRVHSAHSWILLWLVVGLAVASLLMVMVGGALRRRADDYDEYDDPPPRGGLLILITLLALVVLGLSGASGWYLYQTGDSGARMVWEGS